MDADRGQRRAARRAGPGAERRPGARKPPITVERIADAALEIVAADGYDALTMRSVAARLGTGPASLYAHVAHKADLDEVIVGRLCAEIELPQPDPGRWREQILDACVQIRDQWSRYPGISQAAFALAPTNLDALAISEGMLAILLAGGVEPQVAAWAIDALFLYVNAWALEMSIVAARRTDPDDDWVLAREELADRLAQLPEASFPAIRHHATELTAGSAEDRFDFAVRRIVAGLRPADR